MRVITCERVIVSTSIVPSWHRCDVIIQTTNESRIATYTWANNDRTTSMSSRARVIVLTSMLTYNMIFIFVAAYSYTHSLAMTYVRTYSQLMAQSARHKRHFAWGQRVYCLRLTPKYVFNCSIIIRHMYNASLQRSLIVWLTTSFVNIRISQFQLKNFLTFSYFSKDMFGAKFGPHSRACTAVRHLGE